MSDEEKKGELPKSIIGFLDKYGEKLWKGVKNVYKSASDEARVNWRLGYERYLDKAYNKYYYAKSFLSFNEPQPLYDFYVPLSISCGQKHLERVSIDEITSINNFAIIVATGGSGKTMMMRHLFVNAIETTSQVPVFVELRDLNQYDSGLFDLIKKKLHDNNFDFDDRYIIKAFEVGHFSLLLDGFDEVAFEKRDKTINELQDIADKFEKTNIILSSRPDSSLYHWELFSVWEVQPLSKGLAIELVTKTNVDLDVKENFLSALKKDLFENHESFLSNPLLLSIMLLTYENAGNIPHKLSTFYERAYTALFEQHDARKAFHRVKQTELDILDFRKVFSAFCFLSYINDVYSFSESEAFEYLEKSKTITGIDFKDGEFLSDSIQAVCLLIRDGLEIRFSHRSFQEYFASSYNSQIGDETTQASFYNRQAGLSESKSLGLSFEIAPEVVEKALIIPQLTRLRNLIGFEGSLSDSQYIQLFISLIENLVPVEDVFDDEGDGGGIFAGVEDRVGFNIIQFASGHYLADSRYERRLTPKTKLFQLLRGMTNADLRVESEDALANPELLKVFVEGNHWLSKKGLCDVLRLSDTLSAKHKMRKDFFAQIVQSKEKN